MRKLGIKKTQSTAYHPIGNGRAEASVKRIKNVIMDRFHSLDTKNWVREIPNAVMALNSTIGNTGL